jgi:putative spermidine/putrescine transport system ATP-binding protein
MSEPLIKIRQVSKSFGEFLAVDSIDLDIEEGAFVAIMGPSGCGKTTTLRMIAGLEIPDRGSIHYRGSDVTFASPWDRRMPLVWQNLALFPFLNVMENVAFGLRMANVPKVERRERAHQWLDRLGLAEFSRRSVTDLSGGQQQRVALARALAIEPRVLLLDEPLSALDAKVRAELRDQIRSIQQRLEITTVFVTHDQEEAMSMADRVCVMSRGHLEQVATPSVLYSQPATPFVGQFVGISSRIGVTRHGDHVEVLGRQAKIRGDLSQVPAGELEALLRPEDFDVIVNPVGLGVVNHRSFLGATTRLGIGIGGANLRVDVRSSQAEDIEVGTRVDVSVNARDVLVTTPQPTS